jgi:hypothetical protein
MDANAPRKAVRRTLECFIGRLVEIVGRGMLDNIPAATAGH